MLRLQTKFEVRIDLSLVVSVISLIVAILK
jgi:hypothetical protein